MKKDNISRMQTKTCNASLADRRAALETLTFARTETHIPTNPASPEQIAPRRKAMTVINADVVLNSDEIYETTKDGYN
jgi:hypothetical protein